MEDRLKIDDKYEIVVDFKHGKFECLRYGKQWRNLIGDNMVLAMYYEIERLREEVDTLKSELEKKE